MSPPASPKPNTCARTSVSRQSLGHPISIELLALFSLLLLLSYVGIFVSLWFDAAFGSGSVRPFLPTFVPSLDGHIPFLNASVLFVAILLPITWLLFKLRFTRTSTNCSSRADVALELLRVANCVLLSSALTVFLTECFSTRALVAFGTCCYASCMIVYSWSLVLWKWTRDEVHRKGGVLTLLPRWLQKLLLHTSLFEWLTDSSLSDAVAPYLVFLLPLTRTEQLQFMELLPPESQAMMTKPGMVSFLPAALQHVLLPNKDCDNIDGGSKERGRSDGTLETELAVLETTDTCEPTFAMEMCDVSRRVSGSSAGFDFHRPDVVGTIRSPPSPVQLLYEIVASRMQNKCEELVTMPSSRTLNRTAAVSSALFVMQLYASRKSRKVFLTFVQFVAASALSSVACCTLFLRLVQLLDLRWNRVRTMSLLHYARPYLLHSAKRGTPQIGSQPSYEGSMTIRKAASSVSVVVAALYVLRKLRR